MDASTRVRCLEDTRSDILDFIVNWVDDPTAQQNVFWLHGLAGSGKSTISTEIASIFGGSRRLGAFLFFDRDVTGRSDPTLVIRTLAHQLASSDPHIRTAIREVLERNSNVLALPLPLQFQKLICDPLSTIDKSSRPIVVVLDALDECGSTATRASLVDILASHLPSSIRTIIMSRAEIDICNRFESQHHILAYELDITSPANSNDILSYFQSRMLSICTQKKYLQLEIGWPGEEAFHKLVQRASGLFVWASTASKFINAHDPNRRLDDILKRDVASGAEAALDILYTTALETISSWDDEDFVADFRAILGVILVARQPLSNSAIDSLLQLPKHRPSMHTISHLGCVLQQKPTVRVLHPSFADFLMTAKRCGQPTWYFDRSTYHRHLALRCLDRMEADLKRNICDLTLTVDMPTGDLPEELSYSCLFWIKHVGAIEDDSATIIDRISVFISRHLLHWFEAMSISRRSRDTIALLDDLAGWISVRFSSYIFVIFLKMTLFLVTFS
jgi:hypothetical protein